MKTRNIQSIRNIGIIAHVDAGKTTLAERILYYTGKIHRTGDTHKGNATLDHDPQEQQKGITIHSAATTVHWRDYALNLIDTPGHIDFNIEVKRSLRILDGAVAVFDGVAGVEPQSETNWHLADQYDVPRLVLVNKLDRTGADFMRVVAMVKSRLHAEPLVLYLPIGTEDGFHGVVDLVKERALHWTANTGEPCVVREIPESMQDDVREWRAKLIEQAVEQDDAILERWLEGEQPSIEALMACIRKGTITRAFVPVLAASAYRKIGVETVLDAIVDYLPAPNEVNNAVACDPDEPLVALLFKVVTSIHGQLSFLRIYRGTLSSGDSVLNANTGKRERVSLIYEVHAAQLSKRDSAVAGDIVGVVGLKEATTGHTLTALDHGMILEQIESPVPVIAIAVEVKKQADLQKLALALQTLVKEDPSLRVHQDAESGQTILSGMGELQLEVRLHELATRFGVAVNTGRPQVAYRETIAQAVELRYLHKKQSGGAGQYAEVVLRLEPLAEGSGIVFESEIVGGAVPREYVPGVKAGVEHATEAGVLAGHPCVDMKITLLDGRYHEQDSSLRAFEIAALECMKQAMKKASPVLLEPLMQVEVHTQMEYLGDCIGDLSRRRGVIIGQALDEAMYYAVITAHVPLQMMFGYIADLRSLTSGRASFNMQFARYGTVSAQDLAQVLATG